VDPQAEERRRKREEAKNQAKDEFFNVDFMGKQSYHLKSVIGQGAYGIVCSAEHTTTGEKVAIKRIKRVLDSYPMATRILREIKFLRLLKAHDNIIKIKDVLVPVDRNGFNDTFVVLEIMPTDLGRLLQSKTELRPEHIKYFMFQLLRGVYFMHSSHVFHRDLKPNNILINKQCDLRICDFGLARAMFENNDEMVFWTDYVATRWYRAPELIMSYFTNYSTAIDMWSVGCIFAEMLSGGRPLFPGRNQGHQFELITEVTGRPSDEAIERLRSEQAKQFVRTLPPRPRRPLVQLFPNAHPQALDMLDRMLAFDPEKRMSAFDALNHPYFDEYRHLGLGAKGEPVSADEFEFERVKMTPETMRQEFLKEICKHGHEQELHDVFESSVYFSSAVNEMVTTGGQARNTKTLSEEQMVTVNQRDPIHSKSGAYRSSTIGEAEFRGINKKV